MDDRNRFLNRKHVAERYGVTIRTIERWLEDEKVKFPPPVRFGEGPKAKPFWRVSDLEGWEDTRSAKRETPTAP